MHTQTHVCEWQGKQGSAGRANPKAPTENQDTGEIVHGRARLVEQQQLGVCMHSFASDSVLGIFSLAVFLSSFCFLYGQGSRIIPAWPCAMATGSQQTWCALVRYTNCVPPNGLRTDKHTNNIQGKWRSVPAGCERAGMTIRGKLPHSEMRFSVFFISQFVPR